MLIGPCGGTVSTSNTARSCAITIVSPSLVRYHVSRALSPSNHLRGGASCCICLASGWTCAVNPRATMSLAMRHPNERCTSCGMWKRRAAACEHCAKRPNRWQAAVAQLKRGAASDLHAGRAFSMHGLAQNARKGDAGSTAPSGVQVGPGIGASTPHLPLSKPHEHPKVKCSRCVRIVGHFWACVPARAISTACKRVDELD